MMKVFSHCPNLKMWQFSNESRTTNSTHSCLDYVVRVYYTLQYLISIRVWGIASSSVGYCIVYLIRVRHNLQIDRRNNLTLSLFYIESYFEVGWSSLLAMKVYDPNCEIVNRLRYQEFPINNEEDMKSLQSTIIRIGRDVLSDYVTEKSSTLSDDDYQLTMEKTVNAVTDVLIDKGCYMNIADEEIQSKLEL